MAFVDRYAEATQTPVEVGLADPTRIEILAGLEEGDRVVTGPYRVLRDRIRAKEPAGDDDEAADSP